MNRNHAVVRDPTDQPTVRVDQDEILQTNHPMGKGHAENGPVAEHPLDDQATPTSLFDRANYLAKNWLETVTTSFQMLSADNGSCSLLLAQIDSCGKADAKT